ncbi:protein-L-isoaspartate O-methyltransferase [Methanothermobacter wolfeii]|uniref:Protein-L-isoaspartate O-methyltransferase n=1 Tax=Methanothermobacter wolfeii TaxID=145261 RepID=A0A9E7UFX4_METWO|nr:MULTISPECIES: protein-L-isoaspartate O-methyltransferase [Methanothermobacter]MDI6842357.1 protein-L-isoaspartate O-methyltransferase [Methanothermobacter wolfeii]NLM02328.1 protein-L-isoaspartate O-methyltransferase [Methanothermobacter wolfeii]QHN06584.1 protein-L-isoaspartate(D-aspartate) O-methyltransferase [Methanothermobacter sp. THM-1]UXH31129.1 protein-L-isoaspartate O-methyltransferase [Methanothermobacter wolfeii]SCM57685.1 Protein-L-isoaspartate O-methyltransferase [Methanothermo
MIDERRRMVQELIDKGYIRSEPVRRAMEKVPRDEFVPEEEKHRAYMDMPLPIGEGQTISAPHMVAMIAEILDLREGMKVLEIGSGCGYNAAVIAEIIGKDGHLYTIERIRSLYERARRKLRELGYDNVTVIHGDGSQGWPEEAPYDRIYVTAAAPYVPEPLMEQLGLGGKLLIPVGSDKFYQELVLIERISDEDYRSENLGGVAFVPLIGKHGWKFH